jgi:hypothetical protein
MALTGIRIAEDNMDNQALQDVLSKFLCEKKEKVELLSEEALQREADSRPPYVEKPKRKKIWNMRKGVNENIGDVVGDEFIRYVNKDHIARAFGGDGGSYGIQESKFQSDILPVCKRIRFIKTDENGDELVSTIDLWTAPNQIVKCLHKDSGIQRFLRADRMTLIKKSL